MANKQFNWVNFFNGFQSLMIGLGVIVGGIWTFYLYKDLNETRKSELGLKLLKQQIEGTLKINIEIDAKQTVNRDGGEYGIFIDVKFENKSSEYALISLYENHNPLKVFYRTNQENFNFSLVDVQHSLLGGGIDSTGIYSEYAIGSLLFFPYETKVIHFYSTVPTPGVYLITYETPIDDEIAKMISVHEMKFYNDSISLLYKDSLNSQKPYQYKRKWGAEKYIEIFYEKWVPL